MSFPQVNMSVERHDGDDNDDDTGWGQLLTRPPELSCNPASRVN